MKCADETESNKARKVRTREEGREREMRILNQAMSDPSYIAFHLEDDSI